MIDIPNPKKHDIKTLKQKYLTPLSMLLWDSGLKIKSIKINKLNPSKDKYNVIKSNDETRMQAKKLIRSIRILNSVCLKDKRLNFCKYKKLWNANNDINKKNVIIIILLPIVKLSTINNVLNITWPPFIIPGFIKRMKRVIAKTEVVYILISKGFNFCVLIATHISKYNIDINKKISALINWKWYTFSKIGLFKNPLIIFSR